MPAQDMHDAVAVEQVEAKALGFAPRMSPRCPSRSLAGLARTASPRALGTQRHKGAINTEHQHRTAQTARRHLRYPLVNLVTTWRRHPNTLSPSAAWLVSVCMRSLLIAMPLRRPNNARGGIIRYFDGKLRRRLLNVELNLSCTQTQDLVERIRSQLAISTIEIGPCDLDVADQSSAPCATLVGGLCKRRSHVEHAPHLPIPFALDGAARQ